MHIRSFCLLVLTECYGVVADDDACWREVAVGMFAEWDAHVELRHEFRIGDRWERIHIPGQIYLLKLGLLRRGPRWLLRRRVQEEFMRLAVAVLSNTGFSYDGPGGAKSTRTYATLLDAFSLAEAMMRRSALFRVVAGLVNGVGRILYSRLTVGLLWAIGVAVCVVSVVRWGQSSSDPMGQVAPSLVAGAVAFVLGYLLTRLRR
jgi:hypothetical protein